MLVEGFGTTPQLVLLLVLFSVFTAYWLKSSF